MKSAIIVAALLSCSLIGGCRSRMSVTDTSGETAMTSRTYSEKRDSATSITTGLRQASRLGELVAVTFYPKDSAGKTSVKAIIATTSKSSVSERLRTTATATSSDSTASETEKATSSHQTEERHRKPEHGRFAGFLVCIALLTLTILIIRKKS